MVAFIDSKNERERRKQEFKTRMKSPKLCENKRNEKIICDLNCKRKQRRKPICICPNKKQTKLAKIECEQIEQDLSTFYYNESNKRKKKQTFKERCLLGS